MRGSSPHDEQDCRKKCDRLFEICIESAEHTSRYPETYTVLISAKRSIFSRITRASVPAVAILRRDFRFDSLHTFFILSRVPQWWRFHVTLILFRISKTHQAMGKPVLMQSEQQGLSWQER